MIHAVRIPSIAVLQFAACYLEVMLMVTVMERQVKRIREEYFKGLMRQEIGALLARCILAHTACV